MPGHRRPLVSLLATIGATLLATLIVTSAPASAAESFFNQSPITIPSQGWSPAWR